MPIFRRSSSTRRSLRIVEIWACDPKTKIDRRSFQQLVWPEDDLVIGQIIQTWPAENGKQIVVMEVEADGQDTER